MVSARFENDLSGINSIIHQAFMDCRDYFLARQIDTDGDGTLTQEEQGITNLLSHSLTHSPLQLGSREGLEQVEEHPR